MKQAFGRTGRSRRPSINLTSLIDVMFLLLIFFMLSTVFKNNAAMDITLPAAATATEADQKELPHEIYVQSTGDITFGDKPNITLEALEVELRGLLQKNPDAKLALSADEKADYKSFIAVIDLARRVGGEKLIIRTQMPAEAKAPQADTVPELLRNPSIPK